VLIETAVHERRADIEERLADCLLGGDARLRLQPPVPGADDEFSVCRENAAIRQLLKPAEKGGVEETVRARFGRAHGSHCSHSSTARSILSSEARLNTMTR